MESKTLPKESVFALLFYDFFTIFLDMIGHDFDSKNSQKCHKQHPSELSLVNFETFCSPRVLS